MEWRDEGIVIGVRRHGEASVLLELMTHAHGRHLGLVRGGRSSRLQPMLQAGNSVEVVWRARLDEHLGNYAVEGTNLRAAKLMDSPAALYGLSVLGSLSRLLPERDPHPGLYEALGIVVDALHDAELAAPLVVRFELAILSELGFGLDLSACAATGVREDLAYVSPRTGRAVSAAAGEAWQDRLLTLPAFMTRRAGQAHADPRGPGRGVRADRATSCPETSTNRRGLAMPEVRAAFIAAVTRGSGGKERSDAIIGARGDAMRLTQTAAFLAALMAVPPISAQAQTVVPRREGKPPVSVVVRAQGTGDRYPALHSLLCTEGQFCTSVFDVARRRAAS